MLWLGTNAGLFRFDGVRFVRYPEAGDEPLPSTHIKALLAAPDGGIWVGFLQSGVSYLRDGRVTSYGMRDGLPGISVIQLGWDHDGALCVALVDGVACLRGQHWEMVAASNKTRGFAQDRAGRLWVARTDQVLVREPGESQFRTVANVELPYNAFPFIAVSPGDTVWGLLPGGILRRMDPAAASNDDGERLPVSAGARTPLLFDTAGNLWFGGDALYRVSADQLGARRTGDNTVRAERFSHVDGLTAGFVTALFLDREQNIWVATNTGIDRLSNTSVVRLSLPLCPGIGYALAPGDAGALWAACPRATLPTGTLTEIRNGAIVAEQDTEKFTAGYRDADGGVWFGGPNGIGQIQDGRMVTTPLPQELRGTDVQLITRDRDGTLWVSVVGKGVWRVTGDRWSLYEPLPKFMASAETTDSRGTMWFGYSDSRVAQVQAGKARLFDAVDGLEIGHVMAIVAQGTEIWAGGELGFAHFNGKRFLPVLSGCGSSFSGISGIVGTKSGDLWLNAIGGIVRISHQELEHIVSDPEYRAKCEILDSLDGVPGVPIQSRPLPTALATTDGRLWFALTGGIISVDPDHLIRNALAPPVRIWSITSQGREYANRGAILQLPIHTEDLQVNFTAGSLTIPERVRFRYKLDGSDRDWQEGSRRDAVYTNLGPGSYTFRVLASNNDGKWNEIGGSIALRIAPAFYQTKWFYALCAVAFMVLLAVGHRLRVFQVQARTVRLLKARVAERERIARELHDTLLQGIQGLMFRLQAVRELLPGRPGAAGESLDAALQMGDQAIGEGREAVQNLRSSTFEEGDLTTALGALGAELAVGLELQATPEYRVMVEGKPRELNPDIRDDIYRIAREAVRNAYQHANARHIETEVTFGDTDLSVRIRDDGIGVDPTILAGGQRAGHWGLPGMRERSESIGSRLNVWSERNAGTEIELHISAAIAYAHSPTSTFSWIRRAGNSGSSRSPKGGTAGDG
jgi:signal transduction histidine kinase/ligand-binding sensor domain-containing protein